MIFSLYFKRYIIIKDLYLGILYIDIHADFQCLPYALESKVNPYMFKPSQKAWLASCLNEGHIYIFINNNRVTALKQTAADREATGDGGGGRLQYIFARRFCCC